MTPDLCRQPTGTAGLSSCLCSSSRGAFFEELCPAESYDTSTALVPRQLKTFACDVSIGPHLLWTNWRYTRFFLPTGPSAPVLRIRISHSILLPLAMETDSPNRGYCGHDNRSLCPPGSAKPPGSLLHKMALIRRNAFSARIREAFYSIVLPSYASSVFVKGRWTCQFGRSCRTG